MLSIAEDTIVHGEHSQMETDRTSNRSEKESRYEDVKPEEDKSNLADTGLDPDQAKSYITCKENNMSNSAREAFLSGFKSGTTEMINPFRAFNKHIFFVCRVFCDAKFYSGSFLHVHDSVHEF